MSDSKRRRKTYIVNKNFQFRYVAITASLLLTATAMVGINIYYQMGRMMLENPQVIGIAVFLKSVTVTLLIWAVFIIALMAFFGLLMSHRIAGPLKRLEDSIIKLGHGDLTHYARIRKGDEFGELVDFFNDTVINLRQLVLKDKDLSHQTVKEIERIAEQLKKESLSKNELHVLREELHKLLNTVKEITADFKL